MSKFCQSCGTEMPMESSFCVSCGTSALGINQNTNYQAPANGDKSSMGFAILGFMIPLVGLILWLAWKKEYPLKASSAGTGALVGAVFTLIVMMI